MRNSAVDGIFEGDAEIHYRTEGNGEPVVLVHGFGSDLETNWRHSGWFDFFLSLGRKVIALDLRGHGRSQKFHHPGAYTPGKLGQDILDLMDHLAIKKANLMGYSMGAWLSMYLLASSPHRFHTGILGGVGEKFMMEPGRGERIALALVTGSPRSITDRTLRMIRDFADHTGGDIRALSACSRGVHDKTMPPWERISRPVLIVGGEVDDFVGPPHRIAEKIPGATVRMMPGRDHLTLLTDRRFKDAVRDFLTTPKDIEHEGSQGKAAI